MTTHTVSTRRALLKGGALLATPLAAAASSEAVAQEAHKARLAQLEDKAAVRELHQTWLRRINTGAREDAALLADPGRVAFDKAVRSIVADHAAEPDAIVLAADGTSAAGRYHCAVEFETGIAQDCTLAQMAHAQGGGVIRRTERRVLRAEYVKLGGAWAIAKIELAPV